VAVSRDRGRSWHTATLNVTSTSLFGASLVTHDGQTVYAFIRGEVSANPQVKNGLVGIWRTTDGGARWQQVKPRFAGAQPDSAMGVALLPDGRLLVTTEQLDTSNLWYSSDGGREFRQSSSSGPALGWIEDVGGRYIAGSLFGGYSSSTNGISWTPIPSA
jgi:photosystem II stability/assembly factor-like uncharacterized protein